MSLSVRYSTAIYTVCNMVEMYQSSCVTSHSFEISASVYLVSTTLRWTVGSFSACFGTDMDRTGLTSFTPAHTLGRIRWFPVNSSARNSDRDENSHVKTAPVEQDSSYVTHANNTIIYYLIMHN